MMTMNDASGTQDVQDFADMCDTLMGALSTGTVPCATDGCTGTVNAVNVRGEVVSFTYPVYCDDCETCSYYARMGDGEEE